MGIESREIIFCQGDKKELEAITGKKYEFIEPCMGKVDFHNDNCIDSRSTFWGVWTYIREDDRNATNLTTRLMEELKHRAFSKGADAVIHYKTCIFQNRDGVYECFARGTFLRKANHQS